MVAGAPLIDAVRRAGGRAPDYDVVIIVEGCYPFIVGGVSGWLDWLFRMTPHLRFAVAPIVATEAPRESKYEIPDNVTLLPSIALHPAAARPGAARRLGLGLGRGREPALSPQEAGALLRRVLRDGDPQALIGFSRMVEEAKATREQLMNSRFAWRLCESLYEALTPAASFLDAFWGQRALLGGVVSLIQAPLPRARAYHAISTGYAGLCAAHAALATGAPAVVTEHGIYTNERRIDMMGAGWIQDAIDVGHAIDDPRMDVRDLWINAFDAMARATYAAAARITTLYEDNQQPQRALGAPEDALRVIANGIDFNRFASLPRRSEEGPPTVGLIGRVTPVKDVKSYIAAVAEARREIPDLRALMIGPEDEDPAYAAECRALVAQLGLEDAFIFTGRVDIREYLPQLDLVLLTSVSEAQPLVLLEAGAAGLACVATNVGSCREIIQGRSDESPPLGPGGHVVDLVDVRGLAAAIADLLSDAEKRKACGEALRRRVERYFQSERSAALYHALYEEVIGEARTSGAEGGRRCA